MKETSKQTTADEWDAPDLNPNPWKPGLPPGKVSQAMIDAYEVYFSPGGAKWHRLKVGVSTT